jgi:hypothetical protein
MSIKKLRLFLIIFPLIIIPVTADADQGDWVRLGVRTVSDRIDHDTIKVTSAKGDFRKIKIKVEHGGVNFKRVVLHFRVGAEQVVEMRDKIRAGGETRAIDLDGGNRIIRSVDFWYDARSSGGKAVVLLYGRG